MCAVERSHRFARLKGVWPIPATIIARHVETVVHERRAYGTQNPSRSVTTVHGAKNREFDNVFVLWTYKLPPDKVQQRRLLYNAVTRARKNCMLVVLGDSYRVNNDSVLALLGPPQAAFSSKRKSKHKGSKSANKLI
jgi:superfamily I DNA/RNA helicase